MYQPIIDIVQKHLRGRPNVSQYETIYKILWSGEWLLLFITSHFEIIMHWWGLLATPTWWQRYSKYFRFAYITYTNLSKRDWMYDILYHVTELRIFGLEVLRNLETCQWRKTLFTSIYSNPQIFHLFQGSGLFLAWLTNVADYTSCPANNVQRFYQNRPLYHQFDISYCSSTPASDHQPFVFLFLYIKHDISGHEKLCHPTGSSVIHDLFLHNGFLFFPSFSTDELCTTNNIQRTNKYLEVLQFTNRLDLF